MKDIKVETKEVSRLSQNKPDNKDVTSLIVKSGLFDIFAQWMALPIDDRKTLGIVTLGDFVERYKVDRKTLYNWRQKPEFQALKRQHLRQWAQELTPHVIKSLFKRTLRQDFANPKDTELWLQYIEDFNPKQEVNHTVEGQGFTEAHIKILISYLPENEQREFYDTITKLIERAKHYRDLGRNGATVDTGLQYISDGTPSIIPEQTNFIDAKGRPDDKVAEEATADIRGHLGQEDSPSDNQSP
jgi:tRNA splicing endonuclease